jgi:hypothetical protein
VIFYDTETKEVLTKKVKFNPKPEEEKSFP